MAQLSSRRHDVDLTRHDIQGIGDADGLVSLFARLGYDTNTRTQQSPSNLGITAEGTLRPIRKVEMLADREGLFQVYVFEVESVSVTHTRALARAFRNRAGNYLLVLTSDYEQIDFVLIERFLPDVSGKSSGPAAPLVGVRPRVLTVDRRNPGSVALRVLRRFTWTEQDPLAQYDKLLSAYGVADWSEGHFNNRALFSDYYLLQRLQERPDWKEDPKPVYRDLRELYAAAAARCAAKDKATLRKDVVDPVLRLLGFVVETGKKSSGDSAQPDYLLRASDAGSAPLASCLIYPWGRDLDRKDDAHDAETPEENPGAVVVSLLEKGSTPWVILTNGKLWRLYAREAHSRATNYYEIDLAETLAQPVPAASDPGESFRYFWILFRRQAFEPVETERDGRKQRLCLLDRLLLESEDYAKALGESLKARVFEHVFPCLAKGFIAHLRSRGGKEDLPEETLDAVFQGTLTLLYRLLFLMYAEARDLLPQREVRGYFDASLTKIKKEAAEIAGPIADEIEARLRPRYREDGHEIYNRLTRLFRAVDKGDSALNVPTYNGGLYLSDPDDEDDTPEAHAARFLNRHKVPDRFLARALDLLARDEDPKRHELVSIDYKSLGVRHLGSIYEGLLEFKVRIADRKLGVTRDKGREVYAPFAELDEKARKRAEHEGRTIQKGEPYLLNDKGERKATGSYYTPDHIVKYIVEKAVGPVLAEKFDALRPKFREAAQGRRAFFQQQEAFRKKGLKPKPDAQAEFVPLPVRS